MFHNLIGGSFTYVGNGVDNGGKKFPSERYTPYHVPHSTDIAGFMTILHGDMRFYNNIFIQQKVNPFYETYAKEYLKDFQTDKMHFVSGTLPYETYPLTDEYFSRFTAKTCIDYWGNDRTTTICRYPMEEISILMEPNLVPKKLMLLSILLIRSGSICRKRMANIFFPVICVIL